MNNYNEHQIYNIRYLTKEEIQLSDLIELNKLTLFITLFTSVITINCLVFLKYFSIDIYFSTITFILLAITIGCMILSILFNIYNFINQLRNPKKSYVIISILFMLIVLVNFGFFVYLK